MTLALLLAAVVAAQPAAADADGSPRRFALAVGNNLGSSADAVLRYAERNPLRARLVRRAENWRWSSARWWGGGGGPAGVPGRRPGAATPRLAGVGACTGTAWFAALPTGRRPGRSARPGNWACKPPCGRAAARPSARRSWMGNNKRACPLFIFHDGAPPGGRKRQKARLHLNTSFGDLQYR